MRAPLGTIVSLAWRESRTARRRLLLYMSSISLGVAALVAIDSFASNVIRSIHDQSKALLGGDVAFNSRTAWTPGADSVLAALESQGMTFARQIQFSSMAYAPKSGGTRLAAVRAVSPGYPIFGEITTEPAGEWAHLHDAPVALVDESLLIAINAGVGDTLALGRGRFRIAGILRDVPGTPEIASVVGPRVFIADKYVGETQLVIFGSRADYQALGKVPAGRTAEAMTDRYRKKFEDARVRVQTAGRNERNLTQNIGSLFDFVGIVGLVALLLGGVGVASGVTAFVNKKIDTVAVLRCLGATSGQVLGIYVLQSVAMGVLGAAIGVALGVAIQFTLPLAIGDFLPVNVKVALEWKAIATGLGIGAWVALLFALRPLLALRTVSPLQALRRDADPTVMSLRWRDWFKLKADRTLVANALALLARDWPRVAVNAVLVASVIALAASRAGSVGRGLAMAGGIGAVILLLWISATLLSVVARKGLRTGWPYVVRQGVANLYRPANQTRAVVLSLGFGAFLITTLYLVQSNLVRQFDLTRAASRGNLVFFDVQQDQAAGIDSILKAQHQQSLQVTPIVTMRISRINQWSMSQMLDSTNPDSVLRATWALRREYRSTYRAERLESSESMTAGRWFGETKPKAGQPVAELSLEKDLARDLGVKLGDVMTWDVQGVLIKARVTSFREVNWARFEPNFFVVFSPGAIDQAPRTFVVVANVLTAQSMAIIQRDVVRRSPNVSSIDLTLIRRTVSEITEKISLAVRFLAIFSLAIGIPVLFSAVAATSRQRVREGVLLKTLGATSVQIRKIMLAEYALLGLLGALTGMVLSFGGAWAVMKFVFKQQTSATPVGAALAIAGVMLLLTVVIGLLGGRDVFKETPMAALREA